MSKKFRTHLVRSLPSPYLSAWLRVFGSFGLHCNLRDYSCPGFIRWWYMQPQIYLFKRYCSFLLLHLEAASVPVDYLRLDALAKLFASISAWSHFEERFSIKWLGNAISHSLRPAWCLNRMITRVFGNSMLIFAAILFHLESLHELSIILLTFDFIEIYSLQILFKHIYVTHSTIREGKASHRCQWRTKLTLIQLVVIVATGSGYGFEVSTNIADLTMTIDHVRIRMIIRVGICRRVNIPYSLVQSMSFILSISHLIISTQVRLVILLLAH